MKMIFGGYVRRRGVERQQLELVTNPDNIMIDAYVDSYDVGDGVLSISVDPAPEVGPYELVLYAENRRFLLMLNEIGSDGDTNVRTLSSPARENVLVEVLGEPYPNRALTDTLDIVRRAFREFANTGNVSTDLLS
jgi:hypothetical protein